MSTQPPSPEEPRPQQPSSPNPRGSNTGIVLIVSLVVVAIIAGFVAVGVLVSGDDPAATPAQRDQPTPTEPTRAAGHTQVPVNTPPQSTTTADTPALDCTTPPPLPKSPQQFPEPPPKTLAEDAVWRVTLTTNCGDIVMDLDGKTAPQTVSSFLFLSQKGYFDDTKCHRLTTQGLFVLQCGDPTGSGSGGPGYGYGIENAPKDGSYPAGTVAMARTTDPNSNGSQFFIVYEDTTLPTDGGGYSIFGNVVQGLDIVQAIAAEGLAADGTAPKQPVSILSVDVAKQS